MTFNPAQLQQAWPAATSPLPVIIFGAGSIVADAHLPAYKLANIPVAGIFDPDRNKAQALCDKWSVKCFDTAEHAIADAASFDNICFDLATPPAAHKNILKILPHGSIVLIQKPMGSDLAEATQILQTCRSNNLTAAVNFQLRFAPMMLALQDAIAQGMLGQIVDFEGSFALDTPWHLWQFLEQLPRVEIAVHSIHYLDFIRGILGDPAGIHAKTIGHPRSKMAQSRTTAILDYGNEVRCALSVNHDHFFGQKFQVSQFKISGTEGAAFVKLGVNLDYPKGAPDELWIHPAGDNQWHSVPLQGAWFPHAFAGRMANLQRFATGEDTKLVASVEDAWQTMALVEAAYSSSAQHAHPIDPLPRQ